MASINDELKIFVGTYEGLLLSYTVALSKTEKDSGLRYDFHLAFNAHDHLSVVQCMRCSGRGLVASGGSDEAIHVYDGVRNMEVASLSHHTGSVTDVAWIGDAYLLTTGADGLICAWQTKTWQVEHVLGKYKHGVNSMSVHPLNTVALSVGMDRTLRTWNLESGKVVYTTNLKFDCERVKWSPAGKYYVLISKQNVFVYLTETTAEVQHYVCQGSVNAVCFLSEDVMCVGDQGGEMKLFHLGSSSMVDTYKAHDSRVKCIEVVWLRDNKSVLVTASTDGWIKVWRVGADGLNCGEQSFTLELLGQHDCGCRVTCMSAIHPPQEMRDEEQLTQVAPVKKKAKEKMGKSKANSSKTLKVKQKVKRVTNNITKNVSSPEKKRKKLKKKISHI